MKKVNYVLLTTLLLIAAAMMFTGCSQEKAPTPTSVLNQKTGGQRREAEECSITVPDPEPEDLSSLALITADQAQDAALAAYPDATVSEVELDNENGCLVYSVELSNDLEVKVDAGNGDILNIESDDGNDDGDYDDEGDDDGDEGDHEDEGDDDQDDGDDDDEEDPSYECSIAVPDPEPEDLSSLAQITSDQAEESALAAYPGTAVVEVELDNENGCLVYSVELDNGLELKIDAGNGEILHIESDDDDSGGGN